MPDQTTKPEARNGGLAAAAHYFGEVMRARLKPSGHRFNHLVMSVLIEPFTGKPCGSGSKART